MTKQATKSKISVTVDRKGSIEIHGLAHGDLDAPRIAEELGLESYDHLGIMHTGMRADGLSPEAIRKATAAARLQEYEVSEVDLLPEVKTTGHAGDEHEHDVSTTEVLHAHQHGPTRKEKAIYPFIVLGVVVVLGIIGMMVRDHMVRDYRSLTSFTQLAAARDAVPPPKAGLAAFINPDDGSFVEIPVRGWSYWMDKGAITQDCYVRIPELPMTIEDFVTAERSAATLQFRIDLARGEGSSYHADAIYRGGMDVKTNDLTVEVYPLNTRELTLTNADGGSVYTDRPDIQYDSEPSFTDLTRFQIRGFVQATDDGFRIAAPNHAVWFPTPQDPGLRALLTDLAVTDEEIANANPRTAAGIATQEKRTRAFVVMGEMFPWKDGGNPGRRQITKEIGQVTLEGVQLGKVMVRAD